MKKEFRMFEVTLKIGESIYTNNVICKNIREALELRQTIGNVVTIKEVTENFPLSEYKIFMALRDGGIDSTLSNAISKFITDNYQNSEK